MRITLTAEHLQFSCILQEVWVTARFDVLFKSLNVEKTINIFLAHLRFLKSYKSFQCYWASCMQPHPYQNLYWYPLTSSKNFWPKISVAYWSMCNPVVTPSVWDWSSGRMDCDVIDVNLRQTNWPKRALTSMCMEVTYKCRLLGLSLLPALASHAHM